jgi:hypothetical protein
MTFYVSHDETNYQLVNKFFNRGHEIASHSVTYYWYPIISNSYKFYHMRYMLHFYSHKADYPYWMNTSIEFWEKEAGCQREILTTYI